ncbi:hypothetical protein EDB81DRAFT_752067 [Dactylonectria macrodidyma]|uniref:Uncharacterized protein n=1 Tax=Dactylonectria macrodidyma TaxID=307937 RepID=A0A9P9FTB8_9HYPO|nr:hypothetical protein EDB81DRAFT_752067 [Dactylonectria macrodidyma]
MQSFLSVLASILSVLAMTSMALDEISRCDYCRQYFGDVVQLHDQYSSSLCSSDGYTVVEIPSSIISAQKARNQTLEVPEWTQTSTSASVTVTPISFEPFTTTLPQLTAGALPTMASATETSPYGCGGRDGRPMTVICVAFVPRIQNILVDHHSEHVRWMKAGL